MNPQCSNSGVTILVVEDEPLVLDMISQELTDQGFAVLEADTGEAALSIMENGQTVDVLFTDIRLPGELDGWRLAATAREAVGRSRMPIARTRALKTVANARSLSRMRYFGALSQGNASVICRASHSAVGFRVTAAQPPSSVAKNKKCIELLKGNRRDHKQINRCNPLGVIAKEGLPGLHWPIPPGHHVFRNRGLGDIKAQSEQFAMDPGRSPQRVLKAHSSNEVAHLLADPRSAPRGARLPSPVGGKTHSMPTHDGLRSDNGYGVKNARTATIQPDEEGTAGPMQMHPAWRALLQDIELMPKDQDFSFKLPAGLEAVAQHADEKKGNCHHRPGSCSDSVRAATQADGVFGSDSPDIGALVHERTRRGVSIPTVSACDRPHDRASGWRAVLG